MDDGPEMRSYGSRTSHSTDMTAQRCQHPSTVQAVESFVQTRKATVLETRIQERQKQESKTRTQKERMPEGHLSGITGADTAPSKSLPN